MIAGCGTSSLEDIIDCPVLAFGILGGLVCLDKPFFEGGKGGLPISFL